MGKNFMMSEKEIAEISKHLNEVETYGKDFAIDWLRSAFYTHKSQIDYLLKDFRELRELYLDHVLHPLSVHEAQLLNVCRICRKDPKVLMPFLLSFGEEFAHQSCLDEIKDTSVNLPNPISVMNSMIV